MARRNDGSRKPALMDANLPAKLDVADEIAAAKVVGPQQAAPTAGTIAFVGVNTTNPDQVAFVVITALDGGSTFFLTDGGYTGATSGAASTWFRSTEGFLQYTVPSGGLPAGTVIVINGAEGGTPTVARNGGGDAGTVAALAGSGGATTNFSFTSGDTVTAYTVTGGTHLTGTPTLIAFVDLGVNPYANSTTTSNIPTIAGGQVLDLGATAVGNAILTNAANVASMTIAQLSNAANFTTGSTAFNMSTLAPVTDLPPTLTATAVNPTYLEDAAAADLFSGVTASTVESGQTFTSMTLTVTNVTNGASEILGIDGSSLALTNGNAVTTATNGLNVTVSVSGNTATVTFSGAALSTAAFQTLVDGLSYRNSSQNPTDANRVVTITRIVDSGSSTLPSDNDSTPNISSTVNVEPVNDPASVTNLIGDTATFTPGVSTLVHLDSGGALTLTNVDSPAHNFLRVSITDPIGQDALTIDLNGTGVTLVGNQVVVGGSAIGTIDDNLTSRTQIVIVFTGGQSIARIQTLMQAISYTSDASTPTAGTRTILWELQDSGSNLNGGNPDLAVTTFVNVVALNNAGSLCMGDADPALVLEGDSGSVAVTFTVTRGGGSTGAVSATWTVSLLAGFGYASLDDFTTTTGTVSFADGQTTATITVLVHGDFDYEDVEDFYVDLSAPTGGVGIDDPRGIGSIFSEDPIIVGTPGDDGPPTFIGTSDDDYIQGLGGDDVIQALAGNDRVEGGDGIDQLIGGQGNDILYGEADQDVLDGGTENDTLYGGDYHDRLIGGLGADHLEGGDGDDYLSGGLSSQGGLGDDYIDGGDGIDRVGYFTYLGGAGVTVSLLSQGGAQNTGSQGIDTLYNIENVSGTSFADTLTGDHNANWLWGAQANFRINPTTLITSTTNNDTIFGAGGDDIIWVGVGNHVLDGGNQIDTLRFTENFTIAEAGLTLSLLLQGSAQVTGNGTWTISNFENLAGGQGNDTLTGDGDANMLIGERGDDLIAGGGGSDTLSGDLVYEIDTHGLGYSGVAALMLATDTGGVAQFSGNDQIDGGAGDDTVVYYFQAGPELLQIQYTANPNVFSLVRNDFVNPVEEIAQITYNGVTGTITVTGVNSGAHIGTDILTNVEHIRFAIEGGAEYMFDVNFPPVIANLDGDAATFVAGQPYSFFDVSGDAAVSDLDSNFAGSSLVVDITGGLGGGDMVALVGNAHITFGNPVSGGTELLYDGVVVGTYSGSGMNGDASTVTFNANGTAAIVSAVLRAYAYTNSGGSPTAGPRNVEFALYDGEGGSTIVHSTMNVTIPATPSVIDLDGPGGNDSFLTVYFEHNAGIAVVDSDVSIVSSVTGAAEVIVTLTDMRAGDTLFVADNPSVHEDIAYQMVSPGVIRVYHTGTATAADLAHALTWLRFSHTGDNPTFDGSDGQRTITFTVNDTGGASNIAVTTINIAAQNDPAVIGGTDAGVVTEDVTLTASGTLTIADPDNVDEFVPLVSAGGLFGLGTFDMDSAGNWTFTLNNAAVQSLGAGVIRGEAIGVQAADGTTHMLNITVIGTNDAPLIVGDTSGTAYDQVFGGVTAGNLSATDVDDGESGFQPQMFVDTTYGRFSINASGGWTYQISAANPDVRALGTGDTLTDTAVARTIDGTEQIVTITVTGTNDAAIIGGTDTGSVTEDAVVNASGTLTVDDVDTGEDGFQEQSGATTLYGTFSIDANGAWTYALNNALSAIQNLNDGESLTDSIQVFAIDGTSHYVTITINGADEPPPPVSVDLDSGTAGYDYLGAYVENAPGVAIGNNINITATGPNIAGAVVRITDGQFGDLLTYESAYAAGLTVTASATQLIFQGIASVAQYEALLASIGYSNSTDDPTFGGNTDRVISVYVSDPAAAQNSPLSYATISVTAENDVAVMTGSFTGDVYEDSTSIATGTINVSDLDTNEGRVQSQNFVFGTYGIFSIAQSGEWQYTAHSNQGLQGGHLYYDTFRVYSFDGQSFQDVVITVHGNDDPAQVFVIDATGTVVEDSPGQTTDSGQVSIFDSDQNENGWQSGSFNTTYGTFVITQSGSWTYTLNNAAPALLALDDGEQAFDTFAMTGLDGHTTVNINVQILGHTDAPSAPPVLSVPIQDQAINEDNAFNFQVPVGTFTDPDSVLAYSATLADGSPLPTWLSFDAMTRTFSGAPPLNFNGTLSLRVTATDYQNSVSDDFNLAINPVNDAPTIANLDGDAVTFVEDGGEVRLDLGMNADLTDVDTTDFAGGSLTIAITGGIALEYLSFVTDGTIEVSVGDIYYGGIPGVGVPFATYSGGNNGAPLVILFYSGTEAYMVEALLQRLTYLNGNNANPAGPRDITITLNDGDGNANGGNNILTVHTTVNIQQVNDAAIITGPVTGDVTEAGGVNNGTPGTATATGDLNAADVDNPADAWQAVSGGTTANGYGSFALTADGIWTYTLDNNNAAVQALNGAATLADSFTVLTVDGTSQLVTVTIHAQNDAAAVSGTASGDVTEAGGTANGIPGTPTATGDLFADDLDNVDDVWQAVASGAGTIMGYGTYALSASGVWVYTLDDSNPAVQALNGAATLSDSFVAYTQDGTARIVTVTIHGQNDAPVNTIGGTAAVNEDAPVVLTGVSIADDGAPGDTYTVLLSVQHGTLTIRTDVAGGITGANIIGGAQGSNGLTITGTLAQINATLAAANGLLYQGDLNFNGADSLRVSSWEGVPADTASFATALESGALTNPTSLVAGDLNGDGRLDLVYIGDVAHQIGVRLGNGDGTFGAATSLAAGTNPSEVSLADVDGDLDLDIVSTDYAGGGSTNGSVGVRLNDGSGNFAAYQVIATLQSPFDLSSADLNGDGRLDLVVARRDYGLVSVLLASGAPGSFAAPVHYSASGANLATGVILGDFTGDGRVDIVSVNFGNRTTGNAPGSVSLLANNGNGTFAAAVEISTGTTRPLDGKTADLNNDGNLDLVLASYAGNNGLTVMLGNGNGTFGTGTFYAGGGDAVNVSIGDVNGDGILDLITGNGAAATIGIFLGNGNGTFQTRVNVGIGSTTYAETTAIGDFDGDGDLDIAVNRGSIDGQAVLLNNGGNLGDTDVRAIDVLSVNDAPAGTDKTITLNEDSVYVFTAADFGFTDVDGNAFIEVGIYSLPANGQLLLAGQFPVSLFSFVSVADIASGLLTFVPAPDANGTGYASFVFVVKDDGNTGNGGQDTDQSTNTITLNVNPVNDAPVLDAAASPTLGTILEDSIPAGVAISTLIGLGNVTDVDAGAIGGIAVTGFNTAGLGTLQFSINGGLSWFNMPAVTADSAFLLRSTDMVRLLPSANANGTASNLFTFVAWDQTSGGVASFGDTTPGGGGTAFSAASDTVSITVTAVNDAPVLDITPTLTLDTILEDAVSPTGLAVSALVDLTSVAGGLDNVTDVDSGALTGIAITGFDTAGGMLQFSLNGGLSWFNLPAVTEASAFLLRPTDMVRFLPNANFNGTLSDLFTFRAWDQTTGSVATFADTTINGGTTAFSTASETVSITVTAVNDAPVNTMPGTLTIDEDASVTLSTANGNALGVDDVDATTLTVTLTVQHGTLTIASTLGLSFGTGDGGNDATMTFSGTAAAINAALGAGLTYTPNANFNGVDTLLVQTTDNGQNGSGGTQTDTDSITININAINDAPVVIGDGTETAATVTEDMPGAGQTVSSLFSGQYSDAADNQIPNGGASSPGAFSGIAVVANGSSAGVGQWQYFSGGVWTDIGPASMASAQLIGAGTLIRFNPAPNYNGPAPSLTVHLIDNALGFGIVDGMDANLATGGTGGTTAYSAGTVVLSQADIIAVNDAPVNTVPGTQNINEDASVTLSTANGNAISVVDVDATTLTVTLSVNNGTLTIASTLGLSFGTGDGTSDASMTFSGTAAAINAALGAGLTYNPSANYNGVATIGVATSDGGQAGSGPAGTDSDDILVSVAAVNDAPQGTDGTVTGSEDDPLPFTAADFGFSDPVEGHSFAGVVIGSLPTNGTLTNNGGAVSVGDFITLANINAGLFRFTPDADEYGDNYASFTFQVRDSGPSGGVNANTDPSPNLMTINITPDNLPPAVDLNGVATGGIDYSTSFIEDGSPIMIGSPGLIVSDPDEGLGDRIETMTVTLIDRVAGDSLTYPALPPGFAAVTTSDTGFIRVEIFGTGTAEQYRAILAGFTYSTDNQDPTSGGTDPTRTITVTVSDGMVSSAVATTTINITAIDDLPVAQPDVFTINENGSIIGGNLFASNGSGADTDPDGPPLSISAVNGSGGNVGTQITLASGALLTVNANGTFNYDSNGTFLRTPTPGSGASNTPGHDSFSYTLAGGNTVTVTITLTGLDTHDTLFGTAGVDMMFAGIGNDYLDGLAGNDQLHGQAGDDIYLVDSFGEQVFEAAGEGNDTIYTTTSYILAAGQEVETLAAQDNSQTVAMNLLGNEFANTIFGNAGVNFIDGGAGADIMTGFGGDDTYAVDNAGDVVIEESGGGTDTIYTSFSYVLGFGSSVEVLAARDNSLTTALALFGNELNNIILGNNGANYIDGGTGADIMVGYGGDDLYVVDNGGDLVLEGAGGGTDTVYASFSYALAAGQSVEVLAAQDNAATTSLALVGNEIANTILANAGANFLEGGGGADILAGYGGDDIYGVENAGDLVLEGAGGGSDTVYTSVSYTLAAGQSVEVLSARDSSLTTALNLTGNELDNTLLGNAGSNVLDGKGGNDNLIGLAGADMFAFTTALGAGNVDLVFGFEHGIDKIALDDAVFAGIGALGGLDPIAFVAGAAAADASDRIIYNNLTGQLYYDADGIGAGAAVQFATLNPGLTLTATDFTVI